MAPRLKVGTERHCVHPASDIRDFFFDFLALLVIEMYPTGKPKNKGKINFHFHSFIQFSSNPTHHSFQERKESQNKLYRFVQRDVDSESEAREHARSSRCSAVPVSTGAVLV